MAHKIVFIGGGSFLWTERFAVDLFLKESLQGSRLVLVDTDPEALELVAAVCRMANERAQSGWSIETDDLDPALDGADVVVVQISTGGLEAFEKDYRLPEQFGVYHSVADTVGPGGISRTLRNVPVFLDIARRMEARCPEAWMVHVTNPLAQLTRCVARETAIKVVGLCHNYEGTMSLLARLFDVPRSEVDADTFGVNHFSFLRNITCAGEPIGERLTLERYLRYHERVHGPVKTGTTDDQINEMLSGDAHLYDDRLSYHIYKWLGCFPVGGAEHLAENFPYFLNDPHVIQRHRIRRKGVLPRREKGRQVKRQRMLDLLAGRQTMGPLTRSNEALADLVESLRTGAPCRAVVNLPNTGQLENLPREAVVETWARIERDRIVAERGEPVPTVIKGLLEPIIAEEELAVEAAVTGDRAALHQALFVSPLLHRKDEVEALASALLDAQRAYLPQFHLEGVAV